MNDARSIFKKNDKEGLFLLSYRRVVFITLFNFISFGTIYRDCKRKNLFFEANL